MCDILMTGSTFYAVTRNDNLLSKIDIWLYRRGCLGEHWGQFSLTFCMFLVVSVS